MNPSSKQLLEFPYNITISTLTELKTVHVLKELKTLTIIKY